MAGSNPAGGQGFASQLGLNDSTSEYNKMVFVIAQMLGNVRTVQLVKVVSVTAQEGDAIGTVKVHPLVNQVDGIGQPTAHGDIFGIPYLRMQGGKNAIIMDPVVGDIGLLAVCDRDISKVKSTKEEASPGSRRRFDFADGVYIGGLLNAEPEQTIKFEEEKITITDKTGNVVKMDSEGITLTPFAGLPVKVEGNLVVTQNLQIGGEILGEDGLTYPNDLKIGGDVIAGFGGSPVGLKTHTHTQPNDSHGDTEQPTNPGTG